MKYAFMGFERRGQWATLSASEQQRRIGQHQQGLTKLFEERTAEGRSYTNLSVGLHDGEDSKIVRFEGGEHTVFDGPFAETKEVLAGFDIIDFDNRDDAIAWQKSLGITHEGHVSEIRPVVSTGLIYHGHRPTGASKFILKFGGPPANQTSAEADKIALDSERVTRDYVMRGFADVSICCVGIRLAHPREAITIRSSGGEHSITDGPFAETREVIGGFTILDCVTRDEAVEWARRYSIIEGDITEVRQCGFWWTQIN
jgi:hypothetical protein